MSDIHAGFQQSTPVTASETLFHFLDAADAMEPVQRAKRVMMEYLAPRPGRFLLDVGCGPGHEVQRLAHYVGPTGRVVGIDINPFMIAEANRRLQDTSLPIVYQQGDGQTLPFADEYFDGCRAERVLMYVPHPDRMIAEMARVVRSGGRITVFDFDYGGTLFDGSDDRLAQRIQMILTTSVPHGTVGRRLARYFHQAGLEDVTVLPHPILVPYAMYQRVVEPTLTAAQAGEHLSVDERVLWSRTMATAEAEGRFVTVFLGMIVTGRKL